MKPPHWKLSLQVLPMWAGVPLGALGTAFILMKPLGFEFNWITYSVCLAVAAIGGTVAARSYRITVLVREQDSVTYQVVKRSRA